MAATIVVPELGESILEATVGRWLKKEGDPVSAGEVLVTLETDKVDLEVGAERSGVLTSIERREGEDVKIGDVLGVIGEAGAAAKSPQAEPEKAERPAASVAAKRPAAQAESQPTQPAPGKSQEAPQVRSAEPASTPTARRLAQERGVNLSQVLPSAGGRVTKEDVKSYLDSAGTGTEAAAGDKPSTVTAETTATPAPALPAPTPVASPKTTQTPASTGERLEERVRMSRRRQTIARRLVEAQNTAATLTTFNEVDMSAVMEMRKRHKESFSEHYGVGLGISSFFVKACVAALRQFPRINAEIDGDEIVLKHYYDIGIAVGAAEGLVVPVLRDADGLSFAEIEKGIKKFAQQARDRALSLEDLRGGTFTITNGGVFGSLMSTPILNPPQVAILGLHKIQERPVSLNGQIVGRPMMYVALSYDHRIVDGMEAVQFLVRVKQFVEDPASLLLEG
ncbi:MAG TPA: 2-oxoglutarate dehydrogenase complex dihydrolipoyllysine-residue succinyltransferase [Terriglobia bacterium]|nr:2-oxoglutarate dehydrogenase complex dihydrolipoyllysine-residue succinyltransferase [Terriglobia bacterium]